MKRLVNGVMVEDGSGPVVIEPGADNTSSTNTNPELGLDPISQAADNETPASGGIDAPDDLAAEFETYVQGIIDGAERLNGIDPDADDPQTNAQDGESAPPNAAGEGTGGVGGIGSPDAPGLDSTTNGDSNGPAVRNSGDSGDSGGSGSGAQDLTSIAQALGMTPEEAAQSLQFIAGLNSDQVGQIQQIVQPQRPAAASGFGNPVPGSTAPGGPGAGQAGVYTDPYSGQTQFQPQQPIPAQGQPGMPIQQPAPNTPPAPDLSALVDIVPGLSEWVQYQNQQNEQLNQKLSFYETQAQQTAQIELDNRRRADEAAIASAAEQFRAANPNLSDEQFQTVAGRVVQMQVFPSFVQANNGDVGKAYSAAMETMMYADPTLRQQLFQAQHDAMLEQQAGIKNRRDRAAGASAAGGGSAPRSTPAPDPRNMTPQQKNDAMIAEVAAGMRKV